MDAHIEDEERMSIEKIFSTYGEDYFREKEAAVLRNTDRFDDCLIACGGGTPCFFDNMKWMNKTGITVFLDETAANIFHHIINEKKMRPLLKSETTESLRAFIEEKLKERLPFYMQSNISLSADHLNRNGFNFIIKQLP